MNIMVLVLGLLLLIGGVTSLIVFLKKFLQNALENEFSKKDFLIYGATVGVTSLGFMLAILSIFLFNPSWASITQYAENLYQGQAINYATQLSLSLIGSFFFAVFSCLLWTGFSIHYWKSKMIGNQRKTFALFLWGSIPLAFLFFLMWTEGIAPYLSYPLVSGLHFGGGFGWDTTASRGDFHIAWYGVIMLFGVCVSYWVCDHKFYQEFHKHGILDTLVLLVFPAGVIGARIWYVVGNWQREFATPVANGDWASIFRVWDGGLTILGGAFAGALVGVIYMLKARKYVNIRWAMDICAPTILLAQVIGRWGNFFNVEVYGKEVALSSGWAWLPNWLSLQMNCVSGSTSHLGAGMIHVPLFLVEGLLNLGGYFLIVYGLGKGLKKYLAKGDLAGFYFLWYGIVRFILEPMRDTAFNMGTDNSWSNCNSLVYMALGLGIILYFHLYDYRKSATYQSFVDPLVCAVLLLPALFFPFLQSLSVSTGTNTLIRYYGGFELLFGGSSPALLTAYIFLLIALFAYLASVLSSFLKKDAITRPLIYAGLGFSFVGALMFFLGKNWTTLGSTITYNGQSYSNVSYSLSYGFVLTAVFALWSAAIALGEIYGERKKLLEAKREEENA